MTRKQEFCSSFEVTTDTPSLPVWASYGVSFVTSLEISEHEIWRVHCRWSVRAAFSEGPHSRLWVWHNAVLGMYITKQFIPIIVFLHGFDSAASVWIGYGRPSWNWGRGIGVACSELDEGQNVDTQWMTDCNETLTHCMLDCFEDK